MSLCSLFLSLETLNGIEPVAKQSYNTQATSKGSDQPARMCRLIGGFAGRTYHIVGNLMHWLNYLFTRRLTIANLTPDISHETTKNMQIINFTEVSVCRR